MLRGTNIYHLEIFLISAKILKCFDVLYLIFICSFTLLFFFFSDTKIKLGIDEFLRNFLIFLNVILNGKFKKMGNWWIFQVHLICQFCMSIKTDKFWNSSKPCSAAPTLSSQKSNEIFLASISLPCQCPQQNIKETKTSKKFYNYLYHVTQWASLVCTTLHTFFFNKCYLAVFLWLVFKNQFTWN